MDAAVPATPANIILKTLDQCNRHPSGISRSFASASVVIIFRILDAPSRAPHLGHSAPILAAVLHHYQLTMNLDESHKIYIEKLIQQSLHAAVHGSLTRLTAPVLPPESESEDWLTAFQAAVVKLLLAVAWREEARAFLDGGGVAVLANVFTSRSMLNHAAIETALAQTLYYVSMHWPEEMWNEIQVNDTGLSKWIEEISDRCEDENDGLLHYLLATLKTMLHCERFLEALAGSNVVDVFQSVLYKRHQLPLCASLVVNFLLSVADICPTTSLPALCCSVAETMISLEADHSSQLECVKALTLLISQQSDSQTLLSNQHVRDIIRVMRSKLMDEPFTAEMLALVVNTLLNASIRAAFIDRGLLQVVSKAICINLSTLEPHAHISSGHTFNPPAISTEALDACCCVELIVRSEGSFVQLVMTCFYAANSIVNAPIVTQIMESGGAHNAIDVQSIYSRLVDSGADDAIIGCLEEALRVNSFPSLLVNSGCQLLQSVLAFPISISSEAENRWIAVATSFLQRDCTQPRTRELLFGTTLVVLSRGKRSGESAKGQHIKMMKVILGVLSASIQHESSCMMLQAECIGAIRVLEEISKASDSLPDTLVSRCLGVLGKLIGIFILSPSTTAAEPAG
ncbi:hypothetical protein PC121_g14113 [Phytophthora cactorum]|nr:hypothetical protein PC121_g14113 [Phytophthora cactorum]KAG4057738.1 hypothetical protein PC123_g7257 [Phytophthora cactorum]